MNSLKVFLTVVQLLVPLIVYVASPLTADDNPILARFERIDGLVSDDDNATVITIFWDGQVETHYPVYRKLAGNYKGRLSVEELSLIRKSLYESALLQIEPEDFNFMVKQNRNSDVSSSQTTGFRKLGSYRSDVSMVRLTIGVEPDGILRTYQLSGGTVRQNHNSPEFLSMQSICAELQVIGKLIAIK